MLPAVDNMRAFAESLARAPIWAHCLEVIGIVPAPTGKMIAGALVRESC
jgi:hypothetical protein